MDEPKHVLISGGSGLVGTYLTDKLLAAGYEVSHLSRTKSPDPKVKVYQWDIEKKYIEGGAIEQADYIIHLAGAGVVDKPWSTKRKKLIRESRTLSANLLIEKIKELNPQLKAFISASAIGYYGMDTGKELIDEGAPAGDDFLAEVTKAWEASADQVTKLGIRLVKIRIGIVLSARGGALPKMMTPVKLGFGAPLGSGRQYMSWIHIHDLARIFIQALENEGMKGVYNGVAPEPVTNKQFNEQLADVLNKPLFLPNVPAFILKFLLGRRAQILLGGNNISSKKIESEGFIFKFKKLKPALQELIKY